jgi:hypothetical protein
MAKIRLGNRPETITFTVKAALPDGTVGQIKATYRYRTREEFGAMIDERLAAARAQDAAAENAYRLMVESLPPGAEVPPRPNTSVGDMQRRACAANADYLDDILVGWDLDEPLTLPNITQLCGELPAMAQALMDSYRAACVEGQLGN